MFEDDLVFEATIETREEREALLVEMRTANVSREKYGQKLESAKRAFESEDAAYKQKVADYTAGKVPEQEASEALTRRDQAKKAFVLAQDAVAALDAQRLVLNKKVVDSSPSLTSVYKREAKVWLQEAWPELERKVLAAMEDACVALMIASSTPAVAAYTVEQLVERVIKSASVRAQKAKHRLEHGERKGEKRAA